MGNSPSASAATTAIGMSAIQMRASISLYYIEIDPHPGIEFTTYLTALAALIADLHSQGYSAVPACFGFDERDLGELVQWW